MCTSIGHAHYDAWVMEDPTTRRPVLRCVSTGSKSESGSQVVGDNDIHESVIGIPALGPGNIVNPDLLISRGLRREGLVDLVVVPTQ